MGGERDPGETPESQQRGRHISLVDLLNAAITTRLIAKYSAITWFDQANTLSGSEQK